MKHRGLPVLVCKGCGHSKPVCRDMLCSSCRARKYHRAARPPAPGTAVAPSDVWAARRKVLARRVVACARAWRVALKLPTCERQGTPMADLIRAVDALEASYLSGGRC